MIGLGTSVLVHAEEILQINGTLHNSGLSCLTSNLGRIFVKTKVNGRTYSGKKNQRFKKEMTIQFHLKLKVQFLMGS